jgi:hypothetical protein
MKYDVALSFAGEDREYVNAVANELRQLGIAVFYDDFETVNLWGKNLYGHLTNVYQNQARYTIIFLSEYYAKKAWTNHELKAAQARAFNENEDYILPARFDQTIIEGILPTVGYINLNKYTPNEFANLVAEKVKSENIKTKTSNFTHNHPENYKNLVLFTLLSRNLQGGILKFSNIERGETINLTVISGNAQESAFLDGLRVQKGSNLFITYNLQCFSTRINSVNQFIENGNEVWKISLTHEDLNRPHEIALQDLTSDQIAEIRARRILLNEKQTYSSNSLDDAFREAFISGISNIIKLEPYIPSAVYKTEREKSSFDKENYLALIKLLLVQSLIISNTVEYIFTLDLQLISDSQISVKFEGKRTRVYSNVEPPIIRVEGVGKLLEE